MVRKGYFPNAGALQTLKQRSPATPRSERVVGRIAGYELLEIVGRGGWGTVFRARHPRLANVVAVKILNDELACDEEYRERFLREARAMASVSHPSIATCIDVGEADLDPPDLIPSRTTAPPVARKLYLAMEFVHGSDLSAIASGEPVPIPRVIELVVQIAAGLEAAHTTGVVHRDLKPANVRVRPDDRVEIVDFGLAATIPRAESDTDGFKTSRDHILGTLHFMAPEQTRGRTTDPRSDLFSLGVITYLLVTGRLPFTGETMGDVMDAVRHVEPPPMARYANGISDELERIVRKLMAKLVDDRYQSAHEVRTDLVRMKNGLELVPPPPPKAFDWRRLALFAVAVLGVIGAAWIIQQIVDSFSWHRMAVVPLVNHTGDPRLDYLGDGLATVVVGSLIRASRLSVAGISTVQGIPTAERTATKLRHKLGIDGILAGSVTRHADVLHLDLELVEGRHGFTIWAASYDYDLGSSDVVERQIVQDVIQRLAAPPTAERAFWPKSTPPPPGSAYEQVLRAWSALDDPDDPHGPDRALAHVSKALEEDPDFARAWACRSRVLWKLYDRDKEAASLRLAEEAANRAVRLNPELLEARLARAQVYRATSRYGSAISELTDVLRINPNWDEAELHLAAAYRDSGLLVEAESHSLNATDVRPGYWRNWSSLGTVRFLRGDYAGARGAYKKIIDLVPEMNEGYTRLAMVEIKTGNYAAAVRLYDQLPSAVQDGPTANNMGTAYFFEHRLKEARSYYGLAAQVDPRSVDVWLNLGDLHSRAKQPDSARVCYGTALGLADDQLHVNPKSSLLRVQRILSLAKLGRCDEMKSAVAAAVDLLPTDNADIAHRLAKANAVCGRRSESLAAVRRAVALGIPPALLHDEDEFAALVHDPAFPAAPGH